MPRPGEAAAVVVVVGSRSGLIPSEGCSARGHQVGIETRNLVHFCPANKLCSNDKIIS